MRFWQKAYISVLILFIFCFYLSIYLVSSYSYHSALKAERERAFGEAHFIATSIKKDIAAILGRDSDISSGGYAFFLTYSDYYKNSHVYLELWKNDAYLVGNIPERTHKNYTTSIEEQTSRVLDTESKKYMVVTGAFKVNNDIYELIYAHDLSVLSSENTTLKNFLLISGAVITALLATGLYFLLRRLSHPIEELDKTTGYIAGGNLSKRVPVQGKDELAALAHHFNLMADQIEEKIRQLEITAEQKQRFVDNFAHELRTPVTTIKGYVEYLKNANISEDDRIVSFDYILSEIIRIQIMADKLLDLALMKRAKISNECVDILDLFYAAAERERIKLLNQNILLKISSTASEIIGDPVLLGSLCTNLLDNAIKASKEDSVIIMTAKEENGQTMIEITDHGKGIPKQHLSKLTEAFYRVDLSRSRTEGGVGLGLALCEQIVQLHGAKMLFLSAEGQGTTVRITFTTP